jgi:hypothetical protein
MNEAQFRRKRSTDASRKKRFRTQLIVKRGEPVQPYESRWLAYLHEQLTAVAHAEEA